MKKVNSMQWQIRRDIVKNRVAYFGVFMALALIFSYVETLIPINFGIPGVKLGLANLVIVIALYKMKLTEVYLLSVVRVLLSGFIFGNYFSIIYSLAGGLLSLTVMALLKKSKGFSVMGISVAGGVFHNVGQLIVAMLVVETFSVGYYFPVLLVAGLITGLVIGIVSAEMLKRIKNIQFLWMNYDYIYTWNSGRNGRRQSHCRCRRCRIWNLHGRDRNGQASGSWKRSKDPHTSAC